MVLKKIKNNIKYLVLLFFAFNLFIKSYNIQANPSASTYDEVIYSSEAQSIVKYGEDLKGGWKPWHLEPSDSYYTELTSTMLVPGFILFPNNPVIASKFIPLLLGSMIPILLGLIAFRLRRDTKVFVITTTIATFNPWIFQFSRMGYDALFSISFYLIGIVAVLFLHKWKKLWAVIPLFLGFFQYQGHKILLIPLISLCFLFILIENYKLKNIFKNYKKIFKNKNIITSFSILLFAFLLTISYLMRLPNLTSGERISEFSIFDESELSSAVNDARRLSLNSSVNNIFINKYTVLTVKLTDRFLNSFNFKRLFIEGDRGVDTFAVLDYGYFHLIDILLIVVASMFMFANKKDYKTVVFVILFVIIGTFPNVVRTGKPWIIFRAAFSFLGLVLVMGIGGSSFLDTLNKQTKALVITVYLLAVSPFFFTYFFKYPISHTKNIGFYERIAASYIKRLNSKEPIYIVPDRDDATFIYLIHYNNLLTKENREQVSSSMKTRKYEVNNIKIPGGCPRNIDNLENTTTLVYLTKDPCAPKHDLDHTTTIKSLIDSGTIFTVYNDKLCSKYNLGAYPNVKENLFNIEKLSDQEFCENFFSK